MHYSCTNRFPEGWQWFWRGGLHWRVRERVEGAEEPLPQTTGQVLPQTAIQPAGPWRVAMATADVRGYRHSAASSQRSLVSGNGSSCSCNIQQNLWQCGIWVQMDTQLFFFCRFLKFYFICFVYDVLVWKLFIFGTAKRIPQKYLYNISKTILYTFTKVLQYGIIIMLSFERVNLNKFFNHNHCNLQIYLSVIIFAVSLEDFLKVNVFESLVYRHESKIFLK